MKPDKTHKLALLISWLCLFITLEGQCQEFYASTQLEAIPNLSEVLVQTSTMAYAEGWLFIQDQASDFGIQVYDPNTGIKEYEFGRKGRGPGEYLSILVHSGPGPDRLEVTDVTNRKNDIYNVSCLKAKPPVSQAHKCIEATESNVASRQAMILQEDLILNQGATTEGILFVSSGNNIKEQLANTPIAIRNKYERPIHEAMAMTGWLSANPDRTRIAYFADSFDRALFYKRTGDRLKLIKEHKFSFLPEFDVKDYGGSSMLTPSEQYRAAFEHPVGGSKHYFVLYSGKSSEDLTSDEDARSFTNRIRVFDWEGNELQEIFLDRNIAILTVSHDESTIYGVTFNADDEATFVKAAIK